jgi:hypothetical protein
MTDFLEKYDIVNIFRKSIDTFLNKNSFILIDIKILSIDNIYHLKYWYEKSKRQHSTNTIIVNSKYEELLGYFEEVDNGYILVSCDNSQNWKKIRSYLIEHDKNIITIGEHLLLLDSKEEIELDKRYYFKNYPNSFYFKSKVTKISDIYIQSKISIRYFIYRENFYASSDYTTNSYLPENNLFKSVKMTNDHLLMLLSVSNHNSIEDIERIYREKVYKKLLKV